MNRELARIRTCGKAGSVQVDEIEPEIILVIRVVEFEAIRFLVIHGDAVQAYRAGGRDRHRQAVDGPRLIIRLNLMLQRDAKRQPLFIHILHLHPHDGVLRVFKNQRFQPFDG